MSVSNWIALCALVVTFTQAVILLLGYFKIIKSTRAVKDECLMALKNAEEGNTKIVHIQRKLGVIAALMLVVSIVFRMLLNRHD